MDIKLKVGQVLCVDDWSVGSTLRDADGYPGAAFRVTLPRTGVSLPVNVTVTGRKIRWDVFHTGGAVRVRVDFVDEGAEPTSVGAFMHWREVETGTTFREIELERLGRAN
jgi:hypothetical protein